MRKFLIPLLLASVLAPAAASAEEGGFMRAMRAHAERNDRDGSSDRKSSSENRPQRAERSNQADRPQRAERPQRLERADRPARVQRVEQAGGDPQVERADRPARIERVRRAHRDRDLEQRVIQAEPVQQVRVAEPTQRVRRSSGSGFIDGVRSGIRDHDELQRRERARDRDRHRWSGDWRRDHRYDWYGYRNRYGSLFRLGRYYDPHGWGYRRFSIGFSLWPSYYGSNYWLNDPWQYRLPPAYGPYRWVRYYDDALLVNIYTGEVVDVVYNFFW